MKKRILSWLLCLTMLLSLFPAAFAEGESDAAEPTAAETDVPGEPDPVTVGADAPGGPPEIGNADENPGDTDPSTVGADASGDSASPSGEVAPQEPIGVPATRKNRTTRTPLP